MQVGTANFNYKNYSENYFYNFLCCSEPFSVLLMPSFQITFGIGLYAKAEEQGPKSVAGKKGEFKNKVLFYSYTYKALRLNFFNVKIIGKLGMPTYTVKQDALAVAIGYPHDSAF